jgi:very-short-patch-repair endonuclease
MGSTSVTGSSIWAIARRQHGVVSRKQLLDAGLSRQAIEHRLGRGKLHPLRRGVYAVGRPDVDSRGRWMAALLACSPSALLSHSSAAALWGICRAAPGIHITVSRDERHSVPGVTLHHRDLLPNEVSRRENIPLTSPSLTLVDLATTLHSRRLEAAVNEADKLGLTDPERLREEIGEMPRRRGVAALRKMLDDRTFRLTDSELERRFLRLVRAANLPIPLTQQSVCGFRVDFHWPALGLIVETDGLRYHRTAAQQARDQRRDRTLRAAGFGVHRFTHAEIRFEPDYVAKVLRATISSVIRATVTPNAK